jgi:predicted nucleic acid-binding protein
VPDLANATLVDSCVLLDVATQDPVWLDWSSQALATAVRSGPVLVNPVVYAEVSIGYDRIEDLDDALPPDIFRREPLPYVAAFLAGKAYRTYRRRGGSRTTPLPDFFIGAHAAVGAFTLLTRDVRRFRTYFPTVRLIAPEI